MYSYPRNTASSSTYLSLLIVHRKNMEWSQSLPTENTEHRTQNTEHCALHSCCFCFSARDTSCHHSHGSPLLASGPENANNFTHLHFFQKFYVTLTSASAYASAWDGFCASVFSGAMQQIGHPDFYNPAFLYF